MLAEKYPYVDFVYPVHFNPNVRKPIQDIFGEDLIPPDYSKKNLKDSNIFFIEPLDYLSFVFLMEKSYLILTDSGGIQEEAPSLGKPVLVMRNTTERPEAIRLGTVKLVGSDIKTIIFEVSRLFEDNAYYLKLSRAINPYGDGRASERILKLWINLTK
jgi:UDP-N-acetylglucosamine 2-epimerase (non-hydrolysing)